MDHTSRKKQAKQRHEVPNVALVILHLREAVGEDAHEDDEGS